MAVRPIEPDLNTVTNPYWLGATYHRYSGYDVINVVQKDILAAIEFDWKRQATSVVALGAA